MWNVRAPSQVIGNGILLEGTKLVLFGLPKTYKSLMVEQLAFCLTIGSPWIGFPTTPHRILYIQAEISRIPFRGRIVQMGSNIRVPPNFLYFWTDFGLKIDRDTGAKFLSQALDKVKPDILILDPFYKFISSPDEPAVVRAVDNIDFLADKYHLTTVIVHHQRKSRITTSGAVIDLGGAELRGPILEQWADSILHIKGDIDKDRRTISFELRNATQLLSPIDVELDRKRLWFNRV